MNSMSLKKKTLLRMFLSLLITSIVIFTYQTIYIKKSLRNVEDNRISDIGAFISPTIALALWNYQSDVIHTIIQDALKHNSLNEIVVMNDKNEVVYSSGYDKGSIINANHPVRKGILKKGAIIYQDKQIGTIEIYYDYNSINSIINTFKGTLATLIVIQFAIILLCFYFTLEIGVIKPVKKINQALFNISEGEGNLTVRLPVITMDEIGELAKWFNKFVENLEEVITKVKNTAEHVYVSTQEVAIGAQGLSQATQEQAAAVEEVVATIEEMTSSIKQNANNASVGRQKANDMVRMANQSGEVAQELMRGMSEVSSASKQIGDIITTVNDVAFQTNLLALNAAVEAARAVEHGKGFAVVADEVRALAQRSSDASKQIKTLIEDTVNKIETGDAMVKKSGESLEQIIKHIEDLSQVMEEIAAASSEQASGVDELNRAVTQIDSSTQNNASTVEELASTSDNLSNEANELSGTVNRFKVSHDQYVTKRPVRHFDATMKAKRGLSPRAFDMESDFEEF